MHLPQQYSPDYIWDAQEFPTFMYTQLIKAKANLVAENIGDFQTHMLPLNACQVSPPKRMAAKTVVGAYCNLTSAVLCTTLVRL